MINCVLNIRFQKDKTYGADCVFLVSQIFAEYIAEVRRGIVDFNQRNPALESASLC